MYDVHERDVPELLVLTEQRHVPIEELSPWIGAAMNRLCASAGGYGGVSDPPFVIFHGEVNEDSDGPVEVCVPIRPDRGHSEESALWREPAHREAYVRIRKAQVEYPQILSAYDAVHSWIGTEGRTAAGSPREVYFADFDAAGADAEVCDVAWPIS
jgi:effector-binding domain-containing protein